MSVPYDIVVRYRLEKPWGKTGEEYVITPTEVSGAGISPAPTINLDETNRLLKELITLLEIAYFPAKAIEFDKLLGITKSVSAGEKMIIGSFKVDAGMKGYIKKVGLSLPVPVSEGNFTMSLLINNNPVRDWQWTHLLALNRDIGLGKGGLANPIDVTIPIAENDTISFQVSVSEPEVSKSYAVRLKGWLKTV